ncbi:hypothetical protein GC173_05735 [bacterium]|nr:hypothetical protein [bacterium]
MKASRHLALLVTMSLAVATAHADRITLANGHVVEGRIVRENDSTIVVEANGMRLSLDRASVRAMERTPDWENALLEAEVFFRRREALRGIEVLRRANADGAPRERIGELVERSWGGITGSIRQTDPNRKDALAKALGGLMSDDLMTTASLIPASRCFFELDDFDRAAEAIRRVPPALLETPGPEREWALDFMRLYVRRLLVRGEFEKAIGLIEDIRRLAGDSGDAQYPLAHLARAADARNRGDFREALRIIVHDLEPVSPQVARNRIVYTINALVTRARETRQWRDLRDQLEPVRAAFPMEYRLAANELMEFEVAEALERGDHAEVLRLVGTVARDERSEALAAAERQAYYESESARIGDSSPLELMKLGRWCADHGMYREALVVLTKARENPSVAELADELISLTRQKRDTTLLEQANAAFRDGRLDEAEEKLKEIIKDPGRASLMEPDAVNLSDMVKKTRAREKERRPYEAEVLYQRAERAYYQQKIEESFNLLALVLREYPETPAARRAAQLQPEVLSALELAFLEGRPVPLEKLRAEVPVERIQKTDKLAEEISRLLTAIEPAKPR